ncbi:hypothetical protein [Promicromonospora soli]
MVTTIEEPRIRPEWLLGGAITLFGAIVIIVVTLLLGSREDEPVVTPADATALTEGSCAEDLRQPHWVPEEVRRAAAECPADISAGIGRTTAEDHLGTWIIYTLDGAENVETFRGGPGLAWPEEEVRSGAYHPASAITYVAYAGSAELSDELTGDNVTVEWEELHGVRPRRAGHPRGQQRVRPGSRRMDRRRRLVPAARHHRPHPHGQRGPHGGGADPHRGQRGGKRRVAPDVSDAQVTPVT